jgi:polysaccharide export outer membrane protein
VRYFLYLSIFLVSVSCASYKTNILLKSSQTEIPEILKSEANGVEKEYVIQKNDQLRLDIYLYNGERLVDPNPPISNNPTEGAPAAKEDGNKFKYEVDDKGIVKFPMIGEVKLEGLTLRQAEEIARKEYTKFFKEPFVQLSFLNKRVIILGASGGQVIPLVNSGMRLPEILALAKGLPNESKANNIKLVRNDHVYQFDLTTIKGFKEGNVLIEPGDILYIEPVRRPFTEGLRDNYLIGSLLIAVGTLAVLIRSLNK